MQRLIMAVSSSPHSVAWCLSGVMQVTEQLLRTMHLIDETTELTSPRMLAKVLRQTLAAPFAKLWQGLQTGAGSTQAGSAGQASA